MSTHRSGIHLELVHYKPSIAGTERQQFELWRMWRESHATDEVQGLVGERIHFRTREKFEWEERLRLTLVAEEPEPGRLGGVEGWK